MAPKAPVTFPGDTCFIPELTAKHIPRTKGLQWKRVTLNMCDSNFRRMNPRVRGFLVHGNKRTITRLRKRAGLRFVSPAVLKKLDAYKILNLPMDLTWVRHEVRELPDIHEAFKTASHAVEVLATLATGTGYRFSIVFSNDTTKLPGPPEPGLVHVFVGPSPPGAVDRNTPSHLCGVQVEREGLYPVRYVPRESIGITLEDDGGEQYAHIYGSNIYLNLPVGTPEQIKLLESDDLFVKAFIPAWNAFLDYRHPPALKLQEFSVFDSHVNERMDMVRKEAHEDLTSTNAEIERLTRDLTAARTQRMYAIKAIEATDEIFEQQRSILADDWQEIHRNPLVKAVRIAGDALHVETADIIVEHKGNHYRLGHFTIRYPFNGIVSVWAHKPAHPKGIYHPHISPRGAVCYGNVTTALAEAAGEGRFADVVDLVIRWLEQGYDPPAAETKIEEWPQVQEKKRDQLRTPKVSV